MSVLRNPKVLEECICDGVAAQLACRWAAVALKAPINESLVAVFLGMLHLRLLRFMDRWVNTSHRIDDPPDSEFRLEAHSRAVMLRTFCVGLLYEALPSTVDAEAALTRLQDDLSIVAGQQADVLRGPALMIANGAQVNASVREAIRDFGSRIDESGLDDRAIVSLLCGWSKFA